MSTSNSGPPAPRPRKLVLRKIAKDGATESSAAGPAPLPPGLTLQPTQPPPPVAAAHTAPPPLVAAVPPPIRSAPATVPPLPPPRPRAPSYAGLSAPVMMKAAHASSGGLPGMGTRPPPPPSRERMPTLSPSTASVPTPYPSMPSMPAPPPSMSSRPPQPSGSPLPQPPVPPPQRGSQPGGNTVTPLPSRVSVLPMVASVSPSPSDPFGQRVTPSRRPLVVAGAFVGAILIGIVAFAVSPRGDDASRVAATGVTHPLASASAATLGAQTQPTTSAPPLVFTANVNDLPRAPGPRRQVQWVAPRPARPPAPPPVAQAAPPPTPAAAAATTDDDSQDEPATAPAPAPAASSSAQVAAKTAPPSAEAAPAPAPSAVETPPPPPADPLLREMQKAVEEQSKNK